VGTGQRWRRFGRGGRQGGEGARLKFDLGLDGDYLQSGRDSMEVVGIAAENHLPGSFGAEHHVGVWNIGSAAAGKEAADGGGFRLV
jgi:hypothetical protein